MKQIFFLLCHLGAIFLLLLIKFYTASIAIAMTIGNYIEAKQIFVKANVNVDNHIAFIMIIVGKNNIIKAKVLKVIFIQANTKTNFIKISVIWEFYF